MCEGEQRNVVGTKYTLTPFRGGSREKTILIINKGNRQEEKMVLVLHSDL